MNLKDLLSALPEFNVSRAFRIFPESLLLKKVENLEVDSRRVDSESIFVAIRGSYYDTHRFIPEVLERKPLAIVGEKFSLLLPDSTQTFLLQVPDSRGALSALAARWAGDPSREMLTLGVTGTNGKTSSTYLLEHLLQKQGLACGVMGTVDHHLGGQTWEATLTTPDPVQLQRRLREFRRLGAQACAMEVSSHALDQKRVDDIHFNCVGFTNFTRDHLDYHGSLKNYFLTKKRLFTEVRWLTYDAFVYSMLNSGDAWIR
ncbi:MAG: Mur ligase family protein, partial [Bdellovibrio sp.]